LDYIGGHLGPQGLPGNDSGTAIALDSTGNAYITGYTSSSDFAVTPGAYQAKLADGQDAFVTKVSSDRFEPGLFHLPWWR